MAGRRPLVAGNWKMYGTVEEGERLIGRLAPELDAMGEAARRVDIVVCPPFTALAAVRRAASAGSADAPWNIQVGAQNIHWEDRGAFTGEISGPMLRELGCRYAIIGHSERRQLFGETDAGVARRLRAALRHGLRPILCVGETWEERQAGRTEERVAAQLQGALEGFAGPAASGGDPLPADLPERLAVAYEPVWAIGSGRAAVGTDAEEVAALIRRLLAERLGPAGAALVRILYGGSVKPDNMAEFATQPNIDGALVGGASLDAASFAGIIRTAVS